MIRKITRIEDVKAELIRACDTHKALPSVHAPKSNISLLGLIIPSPLWPTDEIRVQPLGEDIDDMWIVFENWFKGLSQLEKLVAFLRSSGVGYKRIELILEDRYKIRVRRTTLSTTFSKALLKIYANARL